MSDEQDPPTPPEAPGDTKNEDVVMVHSPTDDGQGYHVLRLREGNVELGAIRNIREGAPIHGDIVRLSQRAENENLFNVEVLVKNPIEAAPSRTGPAQVATNAYRTNWEAIFGNRNDSGSEAPN